MSIEKSQDVVRASVESVVMPHLCGCGQPVRYIVPDGEGTVGACNKQMRCPSWDQLYQKNQELRCKLAQYETLMKLFKDLSV